MASTSRTFPRKPAHRPARRAGGFPGAVFPQADPDPRAASGRRPGVRRPREGQGVFPQAARPQRGRDHRDRAERAALWRRPVAFRHQLLSQSPDRHGALFAQISQLGADTAWASTTRAYELLPEAFRAYLETLDAVHSFEHSGWPAYFDQSETAASFTPGRAPNICRSPIRWRANTRRRARKSSM